MPSLNRPWRSLEELANDPDFVARAAQEFPSLAEGLSAPQDRRRVLKLMAAGLALAGLGGCQRGPPSGVLVPPVRPEPNAVSASKDMFATASVLQGYAAGVLVQHDVGRPIKVEGNPLHPASLGATDAFAQAELLGFYDPDRAIGLERKGEPQDWQNLQTAMATQRASWAQDAWRRSAYPHRHHHIADARADRSMRCSSAIRRCAGINGSRCRAMRCAPAPALAYGRAVEIVPHIDAADVIVAIDSDLISSAPGHVRFAHDFASRRNPTRGDDEPDLCDRADAEPDRGCG